jgi:hypothetical protein
MSDISFIADLLKEPQVEERFTRTHAAPQEIDKTVTAVIHHFASVDFRCSECKVRTHYLYLGTPHCLDHCKSAMETHIEADIAKLRQL